MTDAQFAELKPHRRANAAAEFVAALSLLAWLNRWNITLTTPLEPEAVAFARHHLAPAGWTPGARAGSIGA